MISSGIDHANSVQQNIASSGWLGLQKAHPIYENILAEELYTMLFYYVYARIFYQYHNYIIFTFLLNLNSISLF